MGAGVVVVVSSVSSVSSLSDAIVGPLTTWKVNGSPALLVTFISTLTSSSSMVSCTFCELVLLR